MARPEKQGIDYFSLDTHMEDKVKLVEAKYGMEGYGLLIKLWQKIYSHGYYIDWKEEIKLLFSNEVNVSINRVNDVVNSCLEWGVFNKNLYEQHNILTSHGIQLRYMKATARRKEVEIIKELNLLKKKELNKNVIFVDINGNEKDENKNQKSEGVNVNNNPDSPKVNADISEQSKVKESKVKKSTSSSKNNSEYNDRKEANQAEKPKDEEEESKTDENYSQIPDAYHKAFNQMITPYQLQMLRSYIEDGITEKAVVMALKQAAIANANSLSYVKKILDDWLEKGVRTEKEARMAIKEHASKVNNNGQDPPKKKELEELYKAGYQ